jgi:hypothetical protein
MVRLSRSDGPRANELEWGHFIVRRSSGLHQSPDFPFIYVYLLA